MPSLSRLLIRLDRRTRFLNRFGLGKVRSVGRSLLSRGIGDVHATVDGFDLVGNVQHRGYFAGGWASEPHTTELLLEGLAPGSVFVDVGAYLGYYGLSAARLGASVVMVEANPATATLLERNIDANGLRERVTVHHCAVGAEQGTATFHVGRGDGSSDGFTDPGAVRQKIEVPVQRLEDLVGTADVLKADIEGAEVEMLRGMPRLLASSRLRRIVVECNEARLVASGSSPAELVATLEAAGFTVQGIDEAGGFSSPMEGGRNLLATR